MRPPGRWSLVLCALFAFSVAAAAAETISAAHYAAPVERYSHFALGRPHEYARLEANTSSGRKLALDLPGDEVFEDLSPRLVHLAAGAPAQILAIVSQRDTGSRLALIRLAGDRLEISAQSAPTGMSRRWLNPVGVADLDGDGRAEIAAVITPHIGGTLKVYRQSGAQLVEVAALAGFSNHVFGTTEQRLSLPFPIAGRMRLLVPDVTRAHLRIVALEGGRLVEIGRCDLPAPISGPLELRSQGEVVVGLPSGQQRIVPQDCLK